MFEYTLDFSSVAAFLAVVAQLRVEVLGTPCKCDNCEGKCPIRYCSNVCRPQHLATETCDNCRDQTLCSCDLANVDCTCTNVYENEYDSEYGSDYRMRMCGHGFTECCLCDWCVIHNAAAADKIADYHLTDTDGCGMRNCTYSYPAMLDDDDEHISISNYLKRAYGDDFLDAFTKKVAEYKTILPLPQVNDFFASEIAIAGCAAHIFISKKALGKEYSPDSHAHDWASVDFFGTSCIVYWDRPPY